jgi:hypothetical protein
MEINLSQSQCFSYEMRLEKEVCLGFKFIRVTAKLIVFVGLFLGEEHFLHLPFSSTVHLGETMGEMFHFRVKL